MNENRECIICHESVLNNEEEDFECKDKHVSHRSCIDRWYESNPYGLTDIKCFLCKSISKRKYVSIGRGYQNYDATESQINQFLNRISKVLVFMNNVILGVVFIGCIASGIALFILPSLLESIDPEKFEQIINEIKK